jgi:hypothetical protein
MESIFQIASLFFSVFPFVPLYVLKLISLKSSGKAIPVIEIVNVDISENSEYNTYDEELGKECPI